MHEIDLIPADYRKERAVTRIAWRCGVAIAALIAIAAIAAGALRHDTSAAQAEIAKLETAASAADMQRAAIEALAQQKQTLESQAVLRSGLNARAPLDDLLISIGAAAVDAGVWFRSWRFVRLGAVVPAAPAGAEEHFVVEPGSDGSRVRSEIVIAGSAADVGGVSALAQALAADSRFDRVQVQRVARSDAERGVDFELALATDAADAPHTTETAEAAATAAASADTGAPR
jgi:Tfp pilus assembly protein PilN